MTKAQSQPKSGTPTPRKAKATKTNGKASKDDPNPVGSVVKVKAEDVETLLSMRTARDDHQQHLGMERAAYLDRESQRLAVLQKATADYEAVVLAVARKMGLVNDEESWRYSPEDNTFVRTA